MADLPSEARSEAEAVRVGLQATYDSAAGRALMERVRLYKDVWAELQGEAGSPRLKGKALDRLFQHTLSSMVHHPQGKTSWLKAAG